MHSKSCLWWHAKRRSNQGADFCCASMRAALSGACGAPTRRGTKTSGLPETISPASFVTHCYARPLRNTAMQKAVFQQSERDTSALQCTPGTRHRQRLTYATTGDHHDKRNIFQIIGHRYRIDGRFFRHCAGPGRTGCRYGAGLACPAGEHRWNWLWTWRTRRAGQARNAWNARPWRSIDDR